MIYVVLSILFVVIAVAGGALYLWEKWSKQQTPKAQERKELNENIPVEDVHRIVKHRYVPSPYGGDRVLAEVVCACGWTDTAGTESYAKMRGEDHVAQEIKQLVQKREAARRVAEKLAENDKGDFAW